ncbi:insecticidal toxin complex protein A [Salmonella enterica]|nr:insecticidal toxin complex protein A [Salmonella enterica]EBE4966285.1 insecticidal toxin complex protein A [Salmonella enterica]EBT5331608.1 insecticidal toxin complex protein A [Salmonella enterica]ECH4619392.1 insecticidal toxin complex protein A [Salmonella enterica]EGG9186600.1 insecticidal toxin complex protein A [Salmonella enterica]
MYLTDEILDKLNASRGSNSSLKQSFLDEKITLPDIMARSFAEVKELTGDAFSWGEKNFLYQQAQKELKENKMAESRILSRANPQLANAVRLGIRQSPMLRSYDDWFPQRAESFVKPDSVASMFSPAAYLTELYREARSLHKETTPNHLDTRRPDLASLPLSQTNMDDELSTLSLSNELLLNNIEAQEDKDYDSVIEMLAAYRQTGATPYNQHYEAARQSIILQDPEFAAFRNNPAVAAKMDTVSLLSIQADISPDLREILTEEISEDNADDLLKKNFGDTDTSAFQSIAYLASWYGLTYDEMSSLLGLVTAAGSITYGAQYYQNDQLLSLVESDGNLSAVLIKRTPGENYSQFGYIELIPLSGDNYQLRFTVQSGRAGEDNPVNIGTTGPHSADLVEDGVISGLNIPVSFNVTLEKTKLTQGVTIGVTRYSPDRSTWNYATVIFQVNNYSFSTFLLKLNKLIRLYKATNIAPSDIRSIIESSNSNLEITSDVLSQLFRVNYYMQRYGIDVSAALVLAGSTIGQVTHGNQASAFTRLFNMPMLSNTEFSADGTAIKLSPSGSSDTFRTSVIKRAFGVNDTELYTLWTLVSGSVTPPDFTCTIENLSALYRVSLLADVHNLSVTELAALLSVSPYASTPVGSLYGEELSTLLGFTDQYTGWLEDMSWTVSDLYLMLTDRYSTTLTPDMENLITTLKSGLAGQGFSQTEEAAITVSAPFIAASTQLDSAETAAAILQWLSQLKPQGLTVSGFLVLATSNDRTNEETSALVSYCQVMGQLALIARNIGLSAAELSWVVAHPSILIRDAATLNHNISTLYDLTQLHALLSRCGTHAAEILTSLSGNGESEKNNLSVKTVAAVLGLDEQALAQALAQCSSFEYFYNWTGLRDALQWLDVAAILGITPADVATLVKLKPDSAYADWVTASHVLQAGLNPQQTAQLNDTLDEALGAAASAYVIKNIAPSWVTNRDQLYGWLLIDNQVSAKIKTTRIAEAIASVQLYVNRALGGQEEDVDYTIKSKKFFSTDWDTYNKRYSTWAGVSQLVYYPENYVDPTLRIGQTGMMDEMLQALSQSQLTSDTVEDAFKTYMTRFEEIANLDIISGYHDGASDQNGITWLIGKSAIGDYYWRSADIGKMSDGKLPTNAWSEWKKVTAALNPVNNLVRPVMFQSRLYLVWVESRETAVTGESETDKVTEYQLKYAHILHDGTWSAPITVALEGGMLPLQGVNINDTGMYCAKYMEQEKLYVYFYKKADSYSKLPADIAGLCLYQDGTTEKIPVDSASEMTGYIYMQLDTTSAVRLNTPYAGGNQQVGISDAKQTDYQWGFEYFTMLYSGSVKGISATVNDEGVILNFNATARIVYNGYEGHRSRTLVDLMKKSGFIDYLFIWPLEKELTTVGSANNRSFELIFSSVDGSDIGTVNVSVLDNIPFASGECIKVFDYGGDQPSNDTSLKGDSKVLLLDDSSKIWRGTEQSSTIDIAKNVYLYISRLNSQVAEELYPNLCLFRDFVGYNTAIPTKDVTLSVSGAATGSFTADNYSKYSLEESLFNFNDETLSVPFSAFNNNTAELTFVMSALNNEGRFLGSEEFTITLTRNFESSMPVISLNKTPDGAQYLQYGFYHVRVNTLFAKQLVARANKGLNAVLSMDTQLLEEPKLGDGSYIEVTFERYNKEKHGDGTFELYLIGWENNTADGSRSRMKYAAGTISSQSETRVRIFVPYNPDKTGDEKDKFYIGVKYSNADYASSYLNMQVFIYDKKEKAFIAESDNPGRTPGLSSLVKNSEPMDFNGANALYFWEMFYYVPMMVFKRLMSESKFTEATQWIKYIWSPDGYLVNDQPATWTWNVRPLEEETAWHTDPLDSVDPDAVAQADPLHYKVATFMSYLDLLIARGDAAYRQLERDTLNEAKMWYVQALDILGDEPYLTENTSWSSPILTQAADKTTQTRTHQALLAVRQQIASGELRTANSLTSLFLPQQNEKLAGYWQTLAQRLYNLRHNLSIDGSPLSLSVYATPAEPTALLSAAVISSQGGSDLPAAIMPSYRFPVMLESARSMAGQLMQFGSTLLSISERQDAEALSELLQTQGAELVRQSIALQDNTISEIDADRVALEASLSGAQSRLESYITLYNEDVNTGEKQAMDLALAASVISITATTAYTVAAGLDAVPNIYGLAFGGSRYGSISRAVGNGIEIAAGASRTAAERISQSEIYRRRREEWEIQRNAAQSEVDQINAQLDALAVRRQGAVLQKTYLETQQSQTQAQMNLLQNKFTSKALYNWLRGKLAAIYYQFYDLTVSRCLMAQKAYQWTLNNEVSFIRPGAWQGTYAGLMAGETLMLNLAQMEQSYLEKDQREKEVMRTVCLSEVYAGLSTDAFTLADQIVRLVNAGSGSAGVTGNGLSVTSDKQLQATLTLSDLKIGDDYPSSLGNIRRIKQISATLPALVGPYQDVRAVLSYGGSVTLPQGCTTTAMSHGMNDSGLFQLDFSDSRWLPFEGIPVDDSGTLALSFPQANSSQKDLLLSLTDIILHIRYTIAS